MSIDYITITVPPSEVCDQEQTLIGERISEHLALTPTWDRRGPGWTGLFHITHIPTGAIVPGLFACVTCVRAAGRRLAELDMDWTGLTLDRDANKLVAGDQFDRIWEIATAATFLCQAETCREANQ